MATKKVARPLVQKIALLTQELHQPEDGVELSKTARIERIRQSLNDDGICLLPAITDCQWSETAHGDTVTVMVELTLIDATSGDLVTMAWAGQAHGQGDDLVDLASDRAFEGALLRAFALHSFVALAPAPTPPQPSPQAAVEVHEAQEVVEVEVAAQDEPDEPAPEPSAEPVQEDSEPEALVEVDEPDEDDAQDDVVEGDDLEVTEDVEDSADDAEEAVDADELDEDDAQEDDDEPASELPPEDDAPDEEASADDEPDDAPQDDEVEEDAQAPEAEDEGEDEDEDLVEEVEEDSADEVHDTSTRAPAPVGFSQDPLWNEYYEAMLDSLEGLDGQDGFFARLADLRGVEHVNWLSPEQLQLELNALDEFGYEEEYLLKPERDLFVGGEQFMDALQRATSGQAALEFRALYLERMDAGLLTDVEERKLQAMVKKLTAMNPDARAEYIETVLAEER